MTMNCFSLLSILKLGRLEDDVSHRKYGFGDTGSTTELSWSVIIISFRLRQNVQFNQCLM